MNEQNKELLLRDLSARLSHGMFVEYDYGDSVKGVTKFHGNYLYLMMLGKLQWKDFKPYLRPMSSMTEEEKHELLRFGTVNLDRNNNAIDVCCVGFKRHADVQDYLNAHHFDYRGLIEKGLAIAVTEKNNPYKE